MRIKILILFFFTITYVNCQSLLGEPIEEYKNQKQMERLYQSYGSLLVINKKVYVVPCDCFPCRDLGGDEEGRSLAGDIEGRNMSGGSEGRKMGGSKEERNIAGGKEGRNMAGSKEGRNMLGGKEGRNMGGSSQNRNSSGNQEERRLGGSKENRSMAGGSEGRNMAGGTEGRNLAGDLEGRNAEGQTSKVFCLKIKDGIFKIENLNPNSNVRFYDGTKLIKVRNLLVSI